MDRTRSGSLGRDGRAAIARRFGLVGLIIVLSALVFGALLSGMQALEAMR